MRGLWEQSGTAKTASRLPGMHICLVICRATFNFHRHGNIKGSRDRGVVGDVTALAAHERKGIVPANAEGALALGQVVQASCCDRSGMGVSLISRDSPLHGRAKVQVSFCIALLWGEFRNFEHFGHHIAGSMARVEHFT